MIKALLFDFDGVILESAGIKTDAFRKLFEEKHPDKVEDFMEYHALNTGISRYIKIQYFYEKILGIKINDKEMEELTNEFSKIVFEKILQASFVKGMPEFLEENYKKFPLFIVTGTPADEIGSIIKKRNLNFYFNEIHGSPRGKTDIIFDILRRYKWDPKEVVFFGDARSDLRAAETTGSIFVARINDNSQALESCKYKIMDFQGFKIKDLFIRGEKA